MYKKPNCPKCGSGLTINDKSYLVIPSDRKSIRDMRFFALQTIWACGECNNRWLHESSVKKNDVRTLFGR